MDIKHLVKVTDNESNKLKPNDYVVFAYKSEPDRVIISQVEDLEPDELDNITISYHSKSRRDCEIFAFRNYRDNSKRDHGSIPEETALTASTLSEAIQALQVLAEKLGGSTRLYCCPGSEWFPTPCDLTFEKLQERGKRGIYVEINPE